MKKNLFISLVFIGLTGWSIMSSDDEKEVERTLPHAFSLEIVTLQQLRNEATAPDSLNTDVFVVGINVCTEDAVCVMPDGIFVSESPNPETSEEQYHFAIQEPRQFEEGRLYLLSVGIRRNETGSRTFLDLLGYSLLESINNPKKAGKS